MSNRISLALLKLFERYRIVFWYDSKRELRGDFESLEMADIEKIELNNNEYGIKYRILREQPDRKFILYREGRVSQGISSEIWPRNGTKQTTLRSRLE
jgi:hypothetical protein